MHLEVVLLRHGQSTGNRDRVFTGHHDSQLTERGRKEALAAARRLAVKHVDEVHSSDLSRALETAEPLLSMTRAPLITSEALRERSFGDLTGRSFQDIEARNPDVWSAIISRDPFFRPTNGESNVDCRKRVGAYLDALFARGRDGRIVIVSHGIAINQMLLHLLGVREDVASPVLFQIENCSIARIEHRDESGTRITCINDKSHLADL